MTDIDTSRYEGRTPIEFWQVTGQGEPEETTDSFLATSLWHIPYHMDFNRAMQGNSKADRNLIQDAPKILKAYEEKCEEVKRLRKQQQKILLLAETNMALEWGDTECGAEWGYIIDTIKGWTQ
tara:strand:- start:6380 stop:6748 length:369 start_codon:yes stop_codon:yes gene_type:complete